MKHYRNRKVGSLILAAIASFAQFIMKLYRNRKVGSLILVAMTGLVLLMSEGSTAFATIMIKASGAVVAVCCYKAGSWLYRKGELGNIDDLEE